MAVPAAVGSTVATRMLYSSRSFEEVIYRDELDHLVSNTTHLEVVYTLTRVQPPGWKGYHRRIDTEAQARGRTFLDMRGVRVLQISAGA